MVVQSLEKRLVRTKVSLAGQVGFQNFYSFVRLGEIQQYSPKREENVSRRTEPEYVLLVNMIADL